MIPFGLCGGSSTFMKLMSEVKNGLANVFAYLDDVIIYSESEEDQWASLQAFFQCVSATLGLCPFVENLFHRRQKCLFHCINCCVMANRQNRFWFGHQKLVMHSKNAKKA